MRRAKKRGPGPSHLLLTPDHAGNVVGVDPHKRTLTATVVDPRGGILASEHFRVSGDGHRALEAWARQFGQIARWGIEGSASWGRHTAVYLIGRGYDVRDVCANRTPRSDRARQRGKSDTLDSERIAREVLAHSLLPKAFKRAGQDQGPDELHQLLGLWHNRRRSILAGRQHLVGEAEQLLCELPLELREQLPDTKSVRPRLAALQRRNRRRRYEAPTTCAYNCWMAITSRSPRSIARRSRSSLTWRSSLTGAARRLASCAVCPPGRSPSCWSKLATCAGSPRAGSRASTALRRCQPRPRRGPASRFVTATTPAAIGASTRSCTGWRSRSSVASRAHSASTHAHAPAGTPRRRPAASSSATSPT